MFTRQGRASITVKYIMTEEELKEKYFEMEKKYIDEKAIKLSEIAMNKKLREQIEVLRIKNYPIACSDLSGDIEITSLKIWIIMISIKC